MKKNIFITIGVTLLFAWIWVLVEYLVEGQITDSLVDNLILLLLIPVFYYAVQGFREHVKRAKRYSCDTECDIAPPVRKVFSENDIAPKEETVVYAILLKFGVDVVREWSDSDILWCAVEYGQDSKMGFSNAKRLLRVASYLCKECSDEDIFLYFKSKWKETT